ncbi:putative disease resistance RPP13-like protein 1 isoform X2 [Humulus lupulus]|uniref:putative disease resistance RPP13-like protein 1 isoform X2 n=1 Tax=Humulus lupulus TaxID=3486 RepID=UPI002B40F57A|nr:putative disease resistance RPP13-like protein 1 isoform X2 [Humulus lupulus]
MADLLVGGALLSGFINVLFDRLASKEVLNFIRGKKVIPKLLKEMEITLMSANVLLNDAEDKQLGDNNVKKWLEDLKEVLYKADHMVDKINTKALQLRMEKDERKRAKSKFTNLIPNMFSSFDNAVKSELADILGSLNHLLAQTKFLGLKKVDQRTTLHRLPAPLLEDSEVFGRDDDKEAIIKILLCDDVGEHKISVIPIVGMGGLGKTTLAQLVYNDSNVQEHFDLKAWVTVSEEFDVFKITKLILETITSSGCGITDLYQLQNELKKVLTGKKFLFVHDDVWNEKYELWDSLKSSFQSGALGSKIIVTTRSNAVAMKMKTGNVQPYELKEISNDDCWKLFAKHVIDNTGIDDLRQDLQEIGKQIIEKCKGHPLAVKSMAGLLRSMSTCEEWTHVLQSGVWELPNSRDIGIVPALWLSYRYLPPHLKPCFSFLSIFPKDYKFSKYDREKLILLWMAQGLLQPQGGNRIEDVGEDYLNALISRSFFQRSGPNQFDLSMHDLIHDLAIYVSGECSFNYDNCQDLHKLTKNTHHFSFMKGENDMRKFENLSRLKYLRSMLAFPLSSTYKIESTFGMVLKVGGCLRVLSLHGYYVRELPDSIGYLKHLRYLEVSCPFVTELPTSICVLYNLETLLLEDCSRLTQLPTNFSKLIKLRHLRIGGTSLKEMPPRICNMINLQTLSGFVLRENGGSRIKELGNLENLHGSLCISGLEYIRDVSDVLEGNLKSKKYLTELILNWKGDVDDSARAKEVLDALQPHVKLKRLTIKGYSGTSLPNWVTHPSYCNLESVYLRNCKYCCVSLQSFQQLSSLKDLRIMKSPHVRDDFHDKGEIFPCLEEFELERCQKVNMALPVCNFPSLKCIDITSCNELVTVFPASAHVDSTYPRLKKLFIRGCPRVESFSEMGLLPITLKTLSIESCDMLIENRMRWNLQRNSSLKQLEIIECGGVVDSFPEEWLLPPTLRILSIKFCSNLKVLNGKSFQHLTSLQELNLHYLEKLECLPNEGLPQTLTSLDIDGCDLLISQKGVW